MEDDPQLLAGLHNVEDLSWRQETTLSGLMMTTNVLKGSQMLHDCAGLKERVMVSDVVR